MATYWVPDLPNIKGISGHPQHFILNSYLQMVPRMHDPAGIYNSLNLWSRLALFELKITNILKSSGWGLEKSELPWEFYCRRCVSCITISLPSFNGLHCKLARITLFIYLG